MNVTVREDLNISDDSLESLFVEVCIPNAKNIIADVVYKAPSAVHSEFMTTFQTSICSRVDCGNKSCIISGDFNINLLNHTNSSSQSFIDLFISYSFLPQIHKPTRITDTSATLIDNFLSNIFLSSKSGILISDISDHLPIFMSPNSSASHNRNFSFSCNFSNVNLEKLIDDLHSFDWTNVLSCNNPETAYNTFLDSLKKIVRSKYSFS